MKRYLLGILVLIIILNNASIIMGATSTKTVKSKPPVNTSKTTGNRIPSSDSYMKPGSFAVSLGVGFSYYYTLDLAFYPGVELSLMQIKISDSIPIDIGVAGRGFYTSYSYTIFADYTIGYTEFGGGAYATGHLSLKHLKINSFFDKIDTYLGVGVAFYAGTLTGTYLDYYKNTFGTAYTGLNSGGLGLASYAGTSYYITDNLAVFAEGNYFAYLGGGTIGVLYKF